MAKKYKVITDTYPTRTVIHEGDGWEISYHMIYKGYTAYFKIGVQGFSLQTRETREEAIFFCDQLYTAFQTLLKNETNDNKLH